MSSFRESNPSLDSYWRSIILIGRNVASYKFALAKSLYELAENETTFISLEDLAKPFSKNICEHLDNQDKQGTSSGSKFLDACRKYNNQEITYEALISSTSRLGFVNVIDAFHVVNQKNIQVRFFVDDRRTRKGITITDNLFKLKELFQFQNLSQETEARWKLVETAWSLNMNPVLLEVVNDSTTDNLILRSDSLRRGITSNRDALNGYQKGKCFYSRANISVVNGSEQLADIDHFFPNKLKPYLPDLNLDGVWNLVLASKECNRGEGGKFAQLPNIRYLKYLHRRNSYLIKSHHPLRDSIIMQTGRTEGQRREFLQEIYNRAKDILIHTWEAPFEYEAQF